MDGYSHPLHGPPPLNEGGVHGGVDGYSHPLHGPPPLNDRAAQADHATTQADHAAQKQGKLDATPGGIPGGCGYSYWYTHGGVVDPAP